MWDAANPGHLDDAAIIRELDGELPPEEARVLREHLSACWNCRSRHSDLTRGITDFAHLYQRNFPAPLSPIHGARPILAARLHQVSRSEPGPHFRRVLPFGFAAIAAAFLCAAALLTSSSPHAELIRPNPRISPGLAAPVSREYVCRMAGVDANGISANTADEVFRRYRIRKPQSGSYEIDYVVPPALGGSQTVDNLWPQPYDAGQWNAHIKDALEDRLETMVCAGSLDIRAAQAGLTRDWIAAYKSYFQAGQPLSVHVNFAKDRPWMFAMNSTR